MKAWKDLFQAYTLECGLSDYEDGCITYLKQTPTGYSAFVEATDGDYGVEIEMQDEVISNITCTCPDAKKGDYCKHMAAVLYEMEEETQNIKIAVSDLQTIQNQKQELKDLISKIPTEELQDMIYSLALSDEYIYNKVMIKYAPITKKQMTRLKNQVDRICNQSFDCDDYVDYDYFKNALTYFLKEYIPLLLEKAYRLEAFDLINYIFYQVGTQDDDDLYDIAIFVSNTCYKYWQTILKQCNEEETQQMLQWFKSHKENDLIDDMQDYICDFLYNEFQDENTLREQLHRLDETINKVQNETYSGESYSAYYGPVNNITLRIQLMEKLNYSKDEILEYRNKHRNFSEIRNMEIQEYLSEGNYQQAIAVLKESKLLDANQKHLVMEHSEQLINLYEQQQMQKEYAEELEYQVLHFTQPTLTYLLKLKQICSKADWEKLRDNFLESESSKWTKYPLLMEEGLYEKVLIEIQKDNVIYVLDEYEDVLKKQMPNEVRDTYIQYLNNCVAQASNIKEYKNIMYYLKKLPCYPDGKKLAKDIVNSWRLNYPNKEDLMNELKKAEF